MLVVEHGRPVRVACGDFIFLVNMTSNGDPDASADVAAVAVALRDVTGRTVRIAATSEPKHRFATDPPVGAIANWIGWVTTAAQLGHGDAVAVGGPITASGPSGSVTIAGTVTLAHFAALAPGFWSESWGALLEHEVGHAVGLGHSRDANDVMFPTMRSTQRATWEPDDRLGLAALTANCPRDPRTTR